MRHLQVIVAVCLCFVMACGADAPPPSAKTAASAPTVPPQPLERTDAFYIISISAPVRALAATICADDAACSALLPPNPPMIVRRFTDESWVVITAPANVGATNVVSDGTTATVTIEQACALGEAKVVLYRVAKSVAKTAIDLVPAPPGCSKTGG